MWNVKTQIELLKNFQKLDDLQKNQLRQVFKKINLLTPDFANTKTAKNQGRGFLSYILHLAPSNLSGVNVCPAASMGCIAACLNTAGRGRFDSIQTARIRKTLFFVKLREEFLSKLWNEITKIESKAAKSGLKAVIRLNGTSDLPWENIRLNDKNVFESFPNVQFYDYTAVSSRLPTLKVMRLPNYDITFSRKENNDDACKTALQLGFRVAAVFDIIPSSFQGFQVIDGDEHDLRFLNPNGVIVGLKAKGKAKHDHSGFVIQSKQCGVAA